MILNSLTKCFFPAVIEDQRYSSWFGFVTFIHEQGRLFIQPKHTSACLILQYNCVKFADYVASLQGAFVTVSVAPQNLL